MNNSNQFTIHVVSLTIAVLAVMSVSSICILSYYQLPIPPELNTLAGGLTGAVGAMLTKTSPTSSDPIKTEITNKSDNPVPVDSQT